MVHIKIISEGVELNSEQTAFIVLVSLLISFLIGYATGQMIQPKRSEFLTKDTTFYQSQK